MKLRFCLISSLLSAALLSINADAVQAQLSGIDTADFRQIEQPTSLKVATTALGLGLIGFELWWFLLSAVKPKTKQTDSKQSTALVPSLSEAISPYQKIATGFSSVYNGIQLPPGVLSIEAAVCPQFSVS